MRMQRERLYSGLCHLFNAIPVWGFVICGLVWLTLREESRAVVFHARQAMTFHVLLMLGLLAYWVLVITARILWQLSPALSSFIAQMNNDILKILLIAYIAVCLYGAILCFSGQRFRYPLLGNRPPS